MRLFAKKDVDIQKLVNDMESCKEFCNGGMQELYKAISSMKLEKIIYPGIKGRRLRRKKIRGLIQDLKMEKVDNILNRLEVNPAKEFELSEADEDAAIKSAQNHGNYKGD